MIVCLSHYIKTIAIIYKCQGNIKNPFFFLGEDDADINLVQPTVECSAENELVRPKRKN